MPESVEALARRRGATTVSVVVPAHDEASTILDILLVLTGPLAAVVDEVVVIDDGSRDGTAAQAGSVDCIVVVAAGSSPGHPVGKGAAMATGALTATGDLVVFVDADVTTFGPHYVTRLVAALLDDEVAVLAKSTYARPLHGTPDEGGRVNALVARPLLARCFPHLAFLQQPLSGEVAIRRDVLQKLTLEHGYGVEVGMLVDVAATHGPGAIVEVDLGERAHRNRPLRELTGHAEQIVDALLTRYEATLR